MVVDISVDKELSSRSSADQVEDHSYKVDGEDDGNEDHDYTMEAQDDNHHAAVVVVEIL